MPDSRSDAGAEQLSSWSRGLVCEAIDTSRGCQGLWCFILACRIVNSVRMQAVDATFAAFPAACRRLSNIVSTWLYRTATRVFTDKMVRSPTGQCSAQGGLLTLRFPEHFQVRHVFLSACRTFVSNELFSANVVHWKIPVASGGSACKCLVPRGIISIRRGATRMYSRRHRD